MSIHTAMQKQNQQFSLLINCHELWDQANALVTEKHRGDYQSIVIHIDKNYFQM